MVKGSQMELQKPSKSQYIVNTIMLDTFYAAFLQANTNLVLYFAYKQIKSDHLTQRGKMASETSSQCTDRENKFHT